MTALPSYSTGTVSVADGGTSVTGAGGANWSAVNVSPGDILQIGEFQTIISDVTDATTLVIPPWGGGVQSGASYAIWKSSIVRVVGGQNALDVNKLLAALNTNGYFVFVGPDDTEPDPSLGEDGQFALQPSTGKMWVKDAGAWVFSGTFRGFGTPAAYDNGHTYNLFDVATLDGSSYVFINETPSAGHTPPNATYWAVLAAKGDTGSTGATGAPGVAAGILQAYSTTTTDSDPGSGTFRLNNATPASATAAYLDNVDAGGVTVSGLFDLFDDSSSTTKGLIRFQKSTDPAVWAMFRVTGSVVDGTGYRKLTLASGVGSGSFTAADVFAITFFRTGDAGTGDMTSTNNLSELANKDTSLSNLGGTTTGIAVFKSSDAAAARTAIKAPLKGHIFGLALGSAGSSSTFSIAVGEAADSTGVDILSLGSAYTKTTSAWAVGSTNGALDTGSIANGTWYYVYIIKRLDTGVVDVLISLSATSPTLPTNYTLFRRIGAMRTNGSAQWVGFSQSGDSFYYPTPIQDQNLSGTVGTSRTLVAVTAPPSMVAMLRIYAFNASSPASFLFQSPSETDRAVGAFMSLTAETSNQGAAGHFNILLNSSSQFAARAGQASGSLTVETMGFIDSRGRHGP